MRGKNNIISKLFLATLIVIMVLTSVQASTQDYELTLINTDYSKTEEETIGQDLVVKYDVIVTLANRGNSTTDEITLKLIDDEDFSVTQKYTFDSMETKTFTFNDYPLTGTGDHELTISYSPTNTSIQKTNSNSGTETITINYEESSSNNTPFINPFFIILGLLIIGIIKKWNMKI